MMPSDRRHIARSVTFIALVSTLALALSCVPRGPAIQREGESFRDFAFRSTARKEKVKGWTDEQRLALPDESGPYDVKLKYGPLVKIIPHDDLEDFKTSDFMITGWRYVARFEVEQGSGGYPKLNLTPGTLNYLFLRHEGGWRAFIGVCEDPIDKPEECQGKSYSVHAETHEKSKDPPGTARFIWSASDETVWIKCGGSCCQLGAALAGG